MAQSLLPSPVRMWMIVLLCGCGLHASVLSYTELPEGARYLQVGAFAKEKSLNRAVKMLHKFPLWVDRSDGVGRLFVVLPKERRRRRDTLKKVRAIVPDAFLKRAYNPLKTGNENSLRHVPFDGAPLDADAILKTRKKFF